MIINYVYSKDINARCSMIDGIATIYCSKIYSGIYYHELCHLLNDDVVEEASTYVELRCDDYAASMVTSSVYINELIKLREEVECKYVCDIDVRIEHLR